jgi:hypothetical protein
MSDITRSSAEQFLGELGSAVSKNPAPAALVGMGLFWLLTSKRSDYALPAAFRASSEAARPGREGSKPDQQSTNPGNSAGLSGSYLSIIRSELSDLMQRQPLVIGAIGLAIGAGLAASIPMSETETAFLGDASASLKTRRAALGSNKVDAPEVLRMMSQLQSSRRRGTKAWPRMTLKGRRMTLVRSCKESFTLASTA